jgi:AraC-like DNA-binding protein
MRSRAAERKRPARYDLALMATAQRTVVELERPGGRADVLIVRRLTADRPTVIHGPGTDHWTVHYTLEGVRPFRIRGVELVAAAESLIVYRRETVAIGPAPRETARWSAISLCFDTGPSRAWLPLAGFERVALDVYRAIVPHAATRQRLRDAFARLADDDQARIASRAVGTIGGGRLAAAPARDDDLRRELMLLTLREVLLLAGADREGAAQLDPRVRAALEEMSSDVTARHTLASLGDETGLSRSRFGHLFRSELGMSPIHALRVMRLRQAALALQYTGDPIERIAEATGFTSLSHLSREFRRHYGVSPRSYRASHGARTV